MPRKSTLPPDAPVWVTEDRRIDEMTEEIFAKRKLLSKLEMEREDQQGHVRDYEKIRETLLSFRELVKDAEPTEIVSLIASVIERVYVTRDGKNEACHIYIKGCATEDYSGEEEYFFRRSGILETESIRGIFSESILRRRRNV